MKNFQQSILLRFFAVAIIGLMVSSCVRVEGPEGPSGQDGREVAQDALEWLDVRLKEVELT